LAATDHESLNRRDNSTLKSIKSYKVIIPIILGFMVIGYLLWKQFDWNELNKIEWKFSVLVWLGIAVLIFALRHLVLAWRLRLLSEKFFSFRKSVELIFIWEFASAVSPTSIGGTAVALFFLSQEKLKSSKAITIILYSIVVDSAFFILSFPLLLILVGPGIIGPDAISFQSLGNYAYSFFIVMGIMFSYAAFIFYGLFIDPDKIKALICFFGRIKWFSKYKKYLRKTGDGIISASYELSHKNLWYHVKVLTATSLAWFMRFAVVNAIIIALISTIKTDLFNQTLLYGRNQNMYIQTAFAPSPGASGFSEIMFGGLYADFVPVGVALLIAIIWRLITYYSYLFAGVIVVPNWIRKLILRRNRKKQETMILPERTADND
jgi:uncharacterized protein (TIRG00374 family)